MKHDREGCIQYCIREMLFNNTEVCLGSSRGVSGPLVSFVTNNDSNNCEIAWLVRQYTHCLWFTIIGLRQKEIDPVYISFRATEVTLYSLTRSGCGTVCSDQSTGKRKTQKEPNGRLTGGKEQLMIAL